MKATSSWYTGLGQWLKPFLRPGPIIGLVAVIAVWRLIDVKLHAPPRPYASVTAKPAVFRPALKPVYDCQRPERFTITALPGNPKDPSAWYRAEQLVMPGNCKYEIITRGKVWWRDQFGYVHEDDSGNQHAGYCRGGNRHVWFISRESEPVVVDVSFSPSRH